MTNILLADLFSEQCKARTGNSLKIAAKYLKNPGLISLGGGIPSSENFPFDELSIKVPVVGHFDEHEVHDNGVTLTSGKHDLREGKSLFDVSVAFNYGLGSGTAQLLRWTVEHTELFHNPPYADWSCTMTSGSTSALDMALRMFCEKGDYVITEEYSFSTAIDTMRQMDIRVVGVTMDDEGMQPDSLDHLLSTWDPAKFHGARRPNIIYTVPTGHNPTGAVQSLQRRKQLYAVAQKHDCYILEDEPYYFLQLPPYKQASNGYEISGSDDPAAQAAELIGSIVPSILSLDVDGRVMRMDSFSKTLAPGSRLGWITASQQVTDKIAKLADLSTQGACGISQLVLWKLVDEHWGHSGYIAWLQHIRREYTRRRHCIISAAERYLPQPLCAWTVPAAGMFFWFSVDYKTHPLYEAGKANAEEIEERLFQAIIANKALVMKGSYFVADDDVDRRPADAYFRATFAAAPFDMIEEAVKRVGEALRKEFEIVA